MSLLEIYSWHFPFNVPWLLGDSLLRTPSSLRKGPFPVHLTPTFRYSLNRPPLTILLISLVFVVVHGETTQILLTFTSPVQISVWRRKIKEWTEVEHDIPLNVNLHNCVYDYGFENWVGFLFVDGYPYGGPLYHIETLPFGTLLRILSETFTQDPGVSHQIFTYVLHSRLVRRRTRHRRRGNTGILIFCQSHPERLVPGLTVRSPVMTVVMVGRREWTSEILNLQAST